MAQSDIVQLHEQLRAPCFKCSRNCISTEESTAPCGQGPDHKSYTKQRVNNCNDDASCEKTEPERHQNNAAQKGTRRASSSQLYVKCPSFCGKTVDLTKIMLAREGSDRLVWNCNNCKEITKKWVKIAWDNFVCVQCTHTQGKTCLIQYCNSNCRTRKALEKKQSQAHKPPVASKVGRMFQKAKNSIESLKGTELKERLTVLKTAWMLGSGRARQPWCQFSNCKKKQLMSKLHSALETFAAERNVSIPAGFYADMVSAIPAKLHKDSRTSGNDFIFKYKHEFYQEVSNFCNNYKEKMTSAAKEQVKNTKFCKTKCLVVPGLSFKKHRRIPTAWKNGRQDISTVDGAAYILAYGKKPTGQYLSLVSRTELQRVAAKAIQRHSVIIKHKRPAQVPNCKQNSKCVIRNGPDRESDRLRGNQR